MYRELIYRENGVEITKKSSNVRENNMHQLEEDLVSFVSKIEQKKQINVWSYIRKMAWKKAVDWSHS